MLYPGYTGKMKGKKESVRAASSSKSQVLISFFYPVGSSLREEGREKFSKVAPYQRLSGFSPLLFVPGAFVHNLDYCIKTKKRAAKRGGKRETQSFFFVP